MRLNFRRNRSKVLLLAAVFAVTSFGATSMEDSEEIPERGYQYEVHAGLNLSNASISGEGASSNNTGFIVGIGAETPVAQDILSLKAELNFNQLGAENDAFGGMFSKTFNYIEVPVLLKAQIPLTGVSPHIIAGPRLAYLVSASANVGNFSLTRNDYNSVELGGYIGAGADFNLGELELAVTARYLFGLTDVDSSDAEWTNQGLQVLTTVFF